MKNNSKQWDSFTHELVDKVQPVAISGHGILPLVFTTESAFLKASRDDDAFMEFDREVAKQLKQYIRQAFTPLERALLDAHVMVTEESPGIRRRIGIKLQLGG